MSLWDRVAKKPEDNSCPWSVIRDEIFRWSTFNDVVTRSNARNRSPSEAPSKRKLRNKSARTMLARGVGFSSTTVEITHFAEASTLIKTHRLVDNEQKANIACIIYRSTLGHCGKMPNSTTISWTTRHETYSVWLNNVLTYLHYLHTCTLGHTLVIQGVS